MKSKLSKHKIVKLNIFKDKRGIFFEKYNKKVFSKIGIKYNFIQDNTSTSKKNVLRGLHFQKKNKQGKLIHVLKGKIFDVIVDLRRKSLNFGKVYSFILSDRVRNILWVPPGFAHGFCVISKFAEIEYKCTNFYFPNDQYTLLWNDQNLNIKWPTKNPIMSKKDKFGMSLDELMKKNII